MNKPLCIDLFCGLGGWTDGFLAEGYDVVGFDIERHQYGDHKYPAQLVIQDVLSLHGSQFRDASVIVASPPCQAYSYRAMPWKRAKALPPPSNELFEACFRIAREAGVPLIVENVKGAQPWVGRAGWHYGSFYLWGDLPGLMPSTQRVQKFNPDGTDHGQGSWFAIADSKNRGSRSATKVSGFNFHQHEKTGKPGGSFQSAAVAGVKNDGGSWFNIAHNTSSGKANNPVSIPAWQKEFGLPGEPDPRPIWGRTPGVKCHGQKHGEEYAMTRGPVSDGVKIGGSGDAYWRKPLEAKRREATAIKNGGDWFSAGKGMSEMRRHNSHSTSRKAASALIAKIPFELSSHIARCFKPRTPTEATR